MNQKETVLPLIKPGRRNAQTGAQLSFKTGLAIRTIREVIRELREDGELILSSMTEGYFIAETEAEARECFHHFSSRFRAMNQTCKKLESNIKQKFGGQIPLI
jgi:biotin operon repressor